jgi:hypothetical protein
MEKFQYDLFYIKHMSIVLDVLIMLETVKTVRLRRARSDLRPIGSVGADPNLLARNNSAAILTRSEYPATLALM